MNINVKKFCSGAECAASLLKSLANEHRLMILCHLNKGECSVSELMEKLEIAQSPLSQHLARLRREGIVATRRDAQTIYYRIIDPRAVNIVQTLYEQFCAPSSKQRNQP